MQTARLVRSVIVLCGLGCATAPRADAARAYALNAAGTQLVAFDTDLPAGSAEPATVEGLAAGDAMIDLDVRPRTAILYALAGDGTTAHVYRITLRAFVTPQATVVSGAMPFTGLSGAMDFDPVNDRLRVVSASGQSYRVDPDSGAVDTLASVAGATLTALAFSNTFDRSTAATLYGIDTGASGPRLVTVGTPNGNDGGASGAIAGVAPLAATPDNDIGFDITANLNEAYALLPGSDAGHSALARINLATGAVSPLGDIAFSGRLKGLAVYTRASTIYGVTTNNELVIVLSADPGTLRNPDLSTGGTARPITGVSGQIVAIDTRPSTGALYALTNANAIYTIDPAIAAATLVANLTGGTLTGASFGMYIDPGPPERIRIVSEAEQFLAIDPDSGAVTALPNIPIGWRIVALSAGPSSALLYGIESGGDQLVRIDPNAAPPTVQLDTALGVDAGDLSSLDVAPADGTLFGALTASAGTTSSLYVLRSGQPAAQVGTVPIAGGAPLRAMAVAAMGHLRVNPAGYSVTEAPHAPPGVLVPMTIERVAGSDGPLTLLLRPVGGSAAVPGVDFTAAETTYTFLPGAPSSVSLPGTYILNDDVPEPDKTLVVEMYAVSFAADGATPPQEVSVTIHDDDGPVGLNPTVQITSPTNTSAYTATSLFIALAGTAADSDGSVVSVTWATDRGFSGTADGTTNWTANIVPLVKGVNTITVTATDNANLTTSATLTVSVNELTYYLAEGATSSFFALDLLLANPNDVEAPITLQFLNEQGPLPPQARTLPPNSRTTIHVNDLPGLAEAGGLSTVVTSTAALPLIVERTMRWDAQRYGAATDHASDGTAAKWYFAEGAQGFFNVYLLLANPQATANVAHVTYLREHEPPVSRDYPLAPYARFTVDIGGEPDLQTRSFGIEVTFDQPGVAERAMYFGYPPQWRGGHESAGINQPSRDWFLAEGATGSYWVTFVLFANPDATAMANVDVSYLLPSGEVVPKHYQVGPQQRLTINIGQEDARLASAAVATEVHADIPIIVERAQYWGSQDPTQWLEAHNSFGVTQAGTSWGLAEGRVGQDDHFQSFILIANPNDADASVTVKFLREDGRAPIALQPFVVKAKSRFTVFGDLPVPELQDESFGAVITSTLPIVVERAMYADALGLHWKAGSNATATRLP